MLNICPIFIFICVKCVKLKQGEEILFYSMLFVIYPPKYMSDTLFKNGMALIIINFGTCLCHFRIVLINAVMLRHVGCMALLLVPREHAVTWTHVRYVTGTPTG